ncbi:SPOR domain-containing protein [Dokdonia sinensis]|uniref:SPOR domain-containing protein n=1 Tax=Dokdonia sinensis TaxID=2479847 RepID=A0A3M0G2M9_9FLAO|nr:SPOR domain-containing protein [Dokdonia sinensis]RMB59194.1 SPOR domain-containing protein [Dokdonia sinensis]
MTFLPRKKSFLTFIFFVSLFAFAKAQSSQTTVNQDPLINELISLKAEMSVEGELNDRYKIQIYSGNLTRANSQLKTYLNKVGTWKSTIKFQTPNYKVWIGNFRSRLEADRALMKIKKVFPSAFIFKP